MPSFQIDRGVPMTNAERQQRWRDKHRPSKRGLQWDAQGRIVTPGQFNAPTAMMPSPPPQPPPSLEPTPTPAPVAAEHNYCPHCGSCLRKRAKAAKLAA